MSHLYYRKRLQRLLLLLQAKQIKDSRQAASLFNCHQVTIKRLIARLRLEGHQISYNKSLKRYVLERDD